jgi:hypothetical protein
MSAGDFCPAASVFAGAGLFAAAGAFASSAEAGAAWKLRTAEAVRRAAVRIFVYRFICHISLSVKMFSHGSTVSRFVKG